MKLGAFRLKSEEETKFDVPSNGMSLLFKANKSPIKDSVAATLRAKETLASLAVQSSESEKKRKLFDETHQKEPKKRKKSTDDNFDWTKYASDPHEERKNAEKAEKRYTLRPKLSTKSCFIKQIANFR